MATSGSSPTPRRFSSTPTPSTPRRRRPPRRRVRRRATPTGRTPPSRSIPRRRVGSTTIISGTPARGSARFSPPPETQVDPAKDIIFVNGNRLPKRLPPKVYLVLNKPKGLSLFTTYICLSTDKKSVMSLLDDYLKSWDKRNSGQPKSRLFTVGRLDVATIGLIIVTNDGDFAQKLSRPSSNFSKEYIATIEGTVSKKHLIAISEGIVIDGIHCVPDSVELLPNQPDMPRPRLCVMVIQSLKRVRISGYQLPSDLGIGKHVQLKQGICLRLVGRVGESYFSTAVRYP